jgi:hypothetical protein
MLVHYHFDGKLPSCPAFSSFSGALKGEWLSLLRREKINEPGADVRPAVKNKHNNALSPSRRREAPCEGTNPPRLFTPGETKALAKSKSSSNIAGVGHQPWVVILTDLKNMADCHE